MVGKYNSEKHRRRSIRLRGYDYSWQGAYYVTICTWQRECLFGEILDGKMESNENGKIVLEEWKCTEDKRPNVELDEYVIMPNHFHGIIIINMGNICRGMARHAPTGRQFAKPIANSLSTIIGAFKSAVTRQINRVRNIQALPVWQRNFYDRIIRNETELNRIRQYIVYNPLQWVNDENNPDNFKDSHRIS